jgi:hypothetical protein
MHCAGQPVQDTRQASCTDYDASSACGDDGGGAADDSGAPGSDGGGAADDGGAAGTDGGGAADGSAATGNDGGAPGNDGGGAADDGGATGNATTGGNEGGGAGDDGAAAAANACDYGATMFGSEGDDDDCKYHVSWTSTPICQSTLGVTFTVTVTYLGTGLPVTNIPANYGVLPEAFIPTSLDASCDDMSTHVSPTIFSPGSPGSGLLETTPTSGVYVGSIIFDQPGEWTVRFHIHEECSDLCGNSPHGHAAFHINVP